MNVIAEQNNGCHDDICTLVNLENFACKMNIKMWIYITKVNLQ